MKDQKIADYLTRKDEWLFLGLILGFALWDTSDGTWATYLGLVGRYGMELGPIVLFKFFQPKLRERTSPLSHSLIWLVVFCLYPFGIVIFDLTPPRSQHFLTSGGDTLLLVFSLELALVFNQGFLRFKRLQAGMIRLGLDRALLLFIMGVSVYLGLLVASDLPLWYSTNSVAHPIRFGLVWQNFGIFLAVSFQFFLLFGCAYLMYWVNRYVLVRHVLAQRGALIYAFAMVVAVVLLYPVLTQLYLWLPINRMAMPLIPSEKGDVFAWDNARVAMAVMVVSLPVILTVRWHHKNNQLNELAKEKAETELELLKQQFNPHFFFNTLNNLYALCLKKSNQAPEVVLTLSEFMRYVVYQGKEKVVRVEEEAQFIRHYIDLQAIRLHKALALDVSVEIDDPNARVAPLLLVILLENAFKHGIEPAVEGCELEVSLKVRDNVLRFKCRNSVDRTVAADHSGGVGLANLRKRLTLIYPDGHQLNLVEAQDSFSAELEIGLGEEG